MSSCLLCSLLQMRLRSSSAARCSSAAFSGRPTHETRVMQGWGTRVGATRDPPGTIQICKQNSKYTNQSCGYSWQSAYIGKLSAREPFLTSDDAVRGISMLDNAVAFAVLVLAFIQLMSALSQSSE